MLKCALLKKSKKTLSKKNCKSIFSKTVRKMAHDTIQWLKNVVHYLNMKTKGKPVDIIDLQILSSLKWDGVYKKGTS